MSTHSATESREGPLSPTPQTASAESSLLSELSVLAEQQSLETHEVGSLCRMLGPGIQNQSRSPTQVLTPERRPILPDISGALAQAHNQSAEGSEL
jgi:hypothetical protein